MKQFLDKYQKNIFGSINGWDRLAIRGTIRWLSTIQGVGSYLGFNNILYKDFGNWAESITKKIRSSCEDIADVLKIRKEYLNSSAINKEALAKEIALSEGIRKGPICMFSVVEPSFSPTVVGNRATKKLEIQMRHRRCIWLYFYFNDPDWGLGHFRLQTWLPFTIKGCLNGREWLARQMDKEKIGYKQSDNCFRWIDDIDRAQQLFDQQHNLNWNDTFSRLAFSYLGIMKEVFEPMPLDYYWSVDESEWASDIMFRHTNELDRLFPLLTRYGIDITDSANVLRFLGIIDKDAWLPRKLAGDTRGDRRRRYEGVRVKHWHDKNSIKVYNKAGNVLRVETTINNTRSFKVFRPDLATLEDPDKWTNMRKGVSDMHRRSQISQKANERYYDALSSCQSQITLKECIESVCRKAQLKNQSVRALNPWKAEDYSLIEFLAQGQWNINGFRNKDLAASEITDKNLTKKQRSSKATRTIRILRAHGLVKKIPKTHRYVLTEKAKTLTALVRAASPVQAQQLMKIAA